MQGLRERGLVDPLQAAARRGDPLFGICVGMQALFEVSEEMGEHPGLDLLRGRVVRFPAFPDQKVPHTGWNQLSFREDAPLFRDLPRGSIRLFQPLLLLRQYQPCRCGGAHRLRICVYQRSPNREFVRGPSSTQKKSQRVGQKVLEKLFRI